MLVALIVNPHLYSAFSAEDERASSVAINTGVDNNRITIGDPIRYSVKITRDKDLTVALPGLAANLGQFEIRDYEVHATREFDTFDVDSIDYVITTFDTGNYVIPPISVFIARPDSSYDTLSTDPIPIRVESVMKGEVTDIRDIKPPLSIARDWTPYYLYGGLGLLVLCLPAAGYWYYKRRRAGKPLLPEKKRIRPAHEIALEALDELAGSSLAEDGDIKEYHIRISDIIRRYIQGRYYIPAPEMTTDQAAEALRYTGIREEIREEIHEFLSGCDLVKFAKVIPSLESVRRTTDQAYEIVNKTKWVFEEKVRMPPEGDSPETETADAAISDGGTETGTSGTRTSES